MKGLCVNCVEWKELPDGNICYDCRDSLLNPLSPNLKALDLDSEVGEAMRGIARRHCPETLGRSLQMKEFAWRDEVSEACEETNPIQTILSQEEAEDLLVRPWLEGQPVPVPPED